MSAIKLLLIVVALSLVPFASTAATLYVDSNATGADDCTSEADAAPTLQTCLGSTWTSTDIIWVADDHSESSSSTIQWTSANDSHSNRIPIYSVDFDTNTYTPATAAQVYSTGGSADIDMDIFVDFHGVYFKSDDEIIVELANSSQRFTDCTFEVTGVFDRPLKVAQNVNSNRVVVYGGEVKFGPSGSQVTIGGYTWFYGTTFTGTPHSQGLFEGSAWSAGGCVGCDIDAVTTSELFDGPNDFWLIGGSLPASPTIIGTASTVDNLSTIRVVTSDANAGGDVSRIEFHSYTGAVTPDSTTYLTAGWDDTEGSNLSHEMSANSVVNNHRPLIGVPLTAYVSATGSKTFTVEIAENFTTSPNQSEVWMDVYYLGTSGSTLWTRDAGREILGTTALTSSSASWTGASGYTTHKLATTVTVNATGYYQVIVYLAKYEAAKFLNYDPLVDVQ